MLKSLSKEVSDLFQTLAKVLLSAREAMSFFIFAAVLRNPDRPGRRSRGKALDERGDPIQGNVLVTAILEG